MEARPNKQQPQPKFKVEVKHVRPSIETLQIIKVKPARENISDRGEP